MARIAGVNIPTNKRVIIALTYIHGIGRKTAVDIADKLGIEMKHVPLEEGSVVNVPPAEGPRYDR